MYMHIFLYYFFPKKFVSDFMPFLSTLANAFKPAESLLDDLG